MSGKVRSRNYSVEMKALWSCKHRDFYLHICGVENISLCHFWLKDVQVLLNQKKILPCSQNQLTSILLKHYTLLSIHFEAEDPTVSIILFFPTLTCWMPQERTDGWEKRGFTALGMIKISLSSKKFFVLLLILDQQSFCIFVPRDFNTDCYYRNFQYPLQNISPSTEKHGRPSLLFLGER